MMPTQMGDQPPVSAEEVQRVSRVSDRLLAWLLDAEGHMRVWIQQDPRYTARYGVTILRMLREDPLEEVLARKPENIRADLVT